MSETRISITLSARRNDLDIEKWVQNFQFFQTKTMFFGKIKNNNYQKFNAKKFNENLQEALQVEFISISYDDNTNFVSVLQSIETPDVVIMSIRLEKSIFDKNYSIISTIIQEIMATSGIIAHENVSEDEFWQNLEDLNIYKIKGKSIDHLSLIPSSIFPTTEIVDIKKNPGYQEYVGNILFGASWKMWFGKEFYQYVHQSVLAAFTEGYRNELLTDDVLCITLYENILDYDNPVNRAKQWAFRKAIDFDATLAKAEEMFKNNRVLDPEMEINDGKFEHGGVKQVICYLTEDNKSIKKSQAYKRQLTEFGAKGDIVFEIEEVI